MPPKVRITKRDIINTAVEIVRVKGELNARDIAKKLSSSTQPIFSNFSTMEELKRAVINEAEVLFREYMKSENEKGLFPPYKAIGMAYIRFAKEESELFKLSYMRDRTGENSDNNELNDFLSGMVQKNTGVSENTARLFHLEMWAYVHGIAVMLATGFLDLDEELISQMLTHSYQGLKEYWRV